METLLMIIGMGISALLILGLLCVYSPISCYTLPTWIIIHLAYGAFGTWYGTMVAIPVVLIWAYLAYQLHMEWLRNRHREAQDRLINNN